MSQSQHTELTLYIPVNYKSFGLLESKVIGVFNPVTFLAKKPTIPHEYALGDQATRSFGDPRIDFETRLTREEELQLQSLVQSISDRIFNECYPDKEQP